MTFMPMSWFLSVWSVLLAVVAWQCGSLPILQAIALAVSGFVLWTLIEYLAHRFLFHLDLKSKWGQQFIFLIHGNHHADPNDRMRNMMPLIVTIPIAALIWFALIRVLGPSGNAAFLGFVSGYFTYDLVHYAGHQSRSRNRILTYLRRHHLKHHFAVPEHNFAITAVFWDRLFGTQAPHHRR
ncbi:sterol desaturase [Neoasaia chiangmaiensis NBRC 101099]|nr:sterol desaturase [Neoasaia chiangmaiensis NBRC 101099]